MKRIYRTLIALYPADHQHMFAAEILDSCMNGRGFAEVTGLLKGSATEWIAKLTTDPTIRGRSLPDLRMMRPPGVPREVWFL